MEYATIQISKKNRKRINLLKVNRGISSADKVINLALDLFEHEN